jgi:glycosyltransferase involved in cell wall biosynthesis
MNKLRKKSNTYRFYSSSNERNKNLVHLWLIKPAQNKSEDPPKVAIFLCIFNGKLFLSEQLRSIENQTHKNWRLYISDDGNCTESLKILNEYKGRYGEDRVVIYSGPKSGFVKNFLSLACNTSIQADYFAFSDQDDIWESDKLERSIQYLKSVQKEKPALYCSRTIIVDKNNNAIGLSPLFSKPPSFANALVQNIGGGNTMLFNQSARKLLIEAGADIPVITHDWWMYLLVIGCNGFVKYDHQPSLRYRQHESNLVGCNITWQSRLLRVYLLMKGKFKEYNDKNISALLKINHLLTEENKKTLNEFIQLRKLNLNQRIYKIKNIKIYRQTLLGNLGLYAAILFNKL